MAVPLKFYFGDDGTVTDVREKNMYYFYVSDPDYKFKPHMVYNQYTDYTLPSEFVEFDSLEDANDSSVIKFEWIDNEGYLKVHHYINSTPITGYVLVYYKDVDNKYNFVFGFKTSEETFTNIYMSSISFKDISVYNENTNLKIGNVFNTAGSYVLSYLTDVGFESFTITRISTESVYGTIGILSNNSYIFDGDVLEISYSLKEGYELYQEIPSSITVREGLNLEYHSKLSTLNFSVGDIEGNGTAFLKRTSVNELTGYEDNLLDLMNTSYEETLGHITYSIYYGDVVSYYSSDEGIESEHTVIPDSAMVINWTVTSSVAENIYLVGDANTYVVNNGLVTYQIDDANIYTGKTLKVDLYNDNGYSAVKEITLREYNSDIAHPNSTELWYSIEPQNEGDTEYGYVSSYVLYSDVIQITAFKIRTFINTSGSASDITNNDSVYLKAYVVNYTNTGVWEIE